MGIALALMAGGVFIALVSARNSRLPAWQNALIFTVSFIVGAVLMAAVS